jgi:hypothetical protein
MRRSIGFSVKFRMETFTYLSEPAFTVAGADSSRLNGFLIFAAPDKPGVSVTSPDLGHKMRRSSIAAQHAQGDPGDGCGYDRPPMDGRRDCRGHGMSQHDTLKEAIESLHGGEATHRESAPVKEIWQGKTIWDGIVEVFHLKGHPKTDRVYAWLHDTGEPGAEPQHVTVLHIHRALTPLDAVRAFIMQEIQSARA